ncbi:Blp family class II bacteriocin [Liquorilactobacillus nagelii]|uniref:Uncharacterized protein n=1 Tax=Liquorilactobacillus hordei DSM 19519 TaxID=1423759 RepID=A0A0R1MKI1_9LACO|nr:Blp family class II bacteriocin [Liquorilactobacillus nagelii]KRL05019.1 hypothetical protein FC92_GL001715 [Liquorilactobacillus hordei DSM 19519]ULQ49321.1 Blp family class II bacteriocin [Liquorilactobacillus nagelii]
MNRKQINDFSNIEINALADVCGGKRHPVLGCILNIAGGAMVGGAAGSPIGAGIGAAMGAFTCNEQHVR